MNLTRRHEGTKKGRAWRRLFLLRAFVPSCESFLGVSTRLEAWILAFCLLVWGACAQAQAPTREELEPVLRAYQDGAAKHDFQKMKSAMADVAVAMLHNATVSFKKPFPPTSSDVAFWQDYDLTCIPFEKCTFLTLKEQGEKAFLVYAFAHTWPSAKERGPQKGFIKANFIHQREGWKLLDCGLQMNSSLTAKYESGDRSFMDDLQLSQFAKTPPLPPLATPADYLAQIQWYTPKGKLIVTVNGIPNELTAMSGFHLILGGLKKGENKIQLQYDPDAKPESGVAQGPSGDLPKVRIHVFSGDKLKRNNGRQWLVHHWKTDRDNREATIRLDDEILAKLPQPEMEF